MRPRFAIVVLASACPCLGCSFVESFDGYTTQGTPDAQDAQVATIDTAPEDTTPRDTTVVDTLTGDAPPPDTVVTDTPVTDAPIDTPAPCTLTVCAGGACVDTDSDPSNCGACGNVVDASMYCVGGSPECRPNTGTCTRWSYDGGAHWVECDFACTDHLGDGSHCVSPSDPSHIYRCYLGASVDGWCVDGSCTSSGCPSDRTQCDSTLSNVFSCFDTKRDSNHCGSCGKQCAPSETCAGSACHAYRVVSTCGACGATEKCCTGQTGWAHPTLCIAGSACPDDP